MIQHMRQKYVPRPDEAHVGRRPAQTFTPFFGHPFRWPSGVLCHAFGDVVCHWATAYSASQPTSSAREHR